MPVELSERELRDAIAVVGEWDREGAQAAQSAFEWMGWEGEERLFLRRYDVQLFVWYVLPRKYLVGLDDKEAVAAALAKTLERLGGQAAGYAEVCRAPETQRLLHAWEAEDLRRARGCADPRRRSGRLRRDACGAGSACGRRCGLASWGGVAERARRLLAHRRVPTARRGDRGARRRGQWLASVTQTAGPHRGRTHRPHGGVAGSRPRARSLDSTVSVPLRSV
jgi:hypothetical protein